MNIEAGQWWETRDGDRVHIIGVAAENVDYSVFAVMRRCNEFFSNTYTRHGKYSDLRDESKHDLVKHLPECTGWDWEPVKYPLWWRASNSCVLQQHDAHYVTYYEVMNGTLIEDKFIADHIRHGDNVGHKSITPEEGATWVVKQKKLPVEAGEGWRLLHAGDVRQHGDEWLDGDGWKPCTVLVGSVISRYNEPVRRRIQPDIPADWKLVGGVPGGMLYFRSTEGT